MPTIQDQLNEIISTFNGSQTKAAEFIGLSKSYLSQLMAGTRRASRQVVTIVNSKYVQMQRAREEKPIPDIRPANALRKIPVVSWTTAGAMASYEDLANQIDELVDSTTRDPNSFAIEVSGESMEREVHSGDYVVLEPNREASSGDMAYVRMTDEVGGGGTLKWFYRSGPQGRVIKLIAENPDWPTTEHPVETVKFAYPVHNIIRRRPKRRV